jgi:hypothetical protein
MTRMLLTCVAVLALLTSMWPVGATSMSGGISNARQTGTHWCQWSVAKACTRWRERGGKFICPPGVNTASCKFQRGER